MTDDNPYLPCVVDDEMEASGRDPAKRVRDSSVAADVALPAEAIQGTVMPRYVAATIDFLGVGVCALLAGKQVSDSPRQQGGSQRSSGGPRAGDFADDRELDVPVQRQGFTGMDR